MKIALKYMNRLPLILLTILIIPFLSSCGAQKKKTQEVNRLQKFYHNTTAKYNGYYNANILLEESVWRLDESAQDNYDKIIPVYKIDNLSSFKGQEADLDEAQKKVGVVVNLHRPSVWTDDCYLLLGKTQYYKGEFDDAENTLQYLIKNFDPKDPNSQLYAFDKKEKKKKDNPRKKKSKKDSKKAKKEAEAQKEQSRKEKIAERKKQIDNKATTPVAEATKKKSREERLKERKRRIAESKRKQQQNKKRKKNTKTEVAQTPKPQKPKPTPKPKVVEKEVKEEVAEEEVKTPEKEGDFIDRDDRDPKKFMLKHRPAHGMGKLWLAKNHIAKGNYFAAEYLLEQLEKDLTIPMDILDDAYVLLVDNAMKQKDYDKALFYVDMALLGSIPKKQKARLAFIKGQLTEKNKPEIAKEAYKKAIKYRPEYDMVFQSNLKINTLLGGDEIYKGLNKMLKDGKNKEYRDQIHYQLAKRYLKDQNVPLAIEELRKSLAVSTDKNQKFKSYHLLAQELFKKDDFLYASKYYDTTATMASSDHEDYFVINERKTNLAPIATNMEAITLQDSLLRISNMSAEEQRALAIKIKKEREKEELKQTAASVENPLNQYAVGQNKTNSRNRSNFFAYNEKLVKSGKKSFEKIWGERPLVDDWRRSQAEGSSEVADDDNSVDGQTYSFVKISQTEIDEIFTDVPKTEGEKAETKSFIEKTMYDLALLYKTNLNRPDLSNAQLDKLMSRFPKSKLRPDILFLYYKNFEALGKKAQADKYYKELVDNFPDSKWLKEEKDAAGMVSNDKVDRSYAKAFDLYSNKNYKEAYEICERAPSFFRGFPEYLPKFALLGAMSIGQLSGRKPYQQALKKLVAIYPKTPEGKRANEILRHLGNITSGDKEATDTPKDVDQKFNASVKNDRHYCLIIAPNSIDFEEVKRQVLAYNKDNFADYKLKTSPIFFPKNDVRILLVKSFKDQAKVMPYYLGLTKDKNKVFKASGNSINIYAISQLNYRLLVGEGLLDTYPDFFNRVYLSK